MEYFSLPQEQTVLLARVHQVLPFVVLQEYSASPEPVAPDESTLAALFGLHGLVRLYLRQDSLAGGFVSRPSPRGLRVDGVRSLAVELVPCLLQPDGALTSGMVGVRGRGWYQDAGVDAQAPRKLLSTIVRELRKLCTGRAVDERFLCPDPKRRVKASMPASPNSLAFAHSGGELRRYGSLERYCPAPEG